MPPSFSLISNLFDYIIDTLLLANQKLPKGARHLWLTFLYFCKKLKCDILKKMFLE